MGRFRRFIDDLALKEIPLHGQQPTGGLLFLQVKFCSKQHEET
jgi:hypothetical protein